MEPRRTMVISVTVLGVAIGIVMFAYMAFGDNTDEDMKTLQQVNVSTINEEWEKNSKIR